MGNPLHMGNDFHRPNGRSSSPWRVAAPTSAPKEPLAAGDSEYINRPGGMGTRLAYSRSHEERESDVRAKGQSHSTCSEPVVERFSSSWTSLGRR